MRFYVPEQLHEEVEDKLTTAGVIVRELADAAACEIAVLRNAPLGAAEYRRLPSVRLVVKHGAGMDKIDTHLLSKAGVEVVRTPGGNAQSVAEWSLYACLDRLRRIGNGRELSGQRAGVVGFGQVGQRLARMLTDGFRCRVRVLDPFLSEPIEFDTASHLKTLLSKCDIIFLSVPLTSETRLMIDAETLGYFTASKPLLINASRAELVDQRAVQEALQSGSLWGYAHDFAGEPGAEELDDGALHGRIMATEHVGGSTEDALRRTGFMVLDEIERHGKKGL